MTEKNILIIVNSVYQLFTAVHMKTGILNNCCADIIITDIVPDIKDCIPRISECGIFSRIIFAESSSLDKKYITGTNAEISQGYSNKDSILQWILSDEPGNYSEVYFSNFDTLTRMLACKYYDKPCEFIWYEDGFSSYVIDYLRPERAAVNRHAEGGKIRGKVRSVLLYEPRLSVRNDSLKNKPLPKIKIGDSRLKQLLNHIFGYRRERVDADYIFMEQSFRADGIKCNDIELIKLCKNSLSPGSFIVKPHPRNPQNLPFEQGLTRKYPNSSPWELYLLNGEALNKTVITVCSNAALTGRIVFGAQTNTIMLYKLFEGKILWQEDELLKTYLDRFLKQTAKSKYYVPQTVYELKNILNYLGG